MTRPLRWLRWPAVVAPYTLAVWAVAQPTTFIHSRTLDNYARGSAHEHFGTDSVFLGWPVVWYEWRREVVDFCDPTTGAVDRTERLVTTHAGENFAVPFAWLFVAHAAAFGIAARTSSRPAHYAGVWPWARTMGIAGAGALAVAAIDLETAHDMPAPTVFLDRLMDTPPHHTRGGRPSTVPVPAGWTLTKDGRCCYPMTHDPYRRPAPRLDANLSDLAAWRLRSGLLRPVLTTSVENVLPNGRRVAWQEEEPVVATLLGRWTAREQLTAGALLFAAVTLAVAAWWRGRRLAPPLQPDAGRPPSPSPPPVAL